MHRRPTAVTPRLMFVLAAATLATSTTRASEVTTRMSVDAAGQQVNSDSDFPALSRNGRYVAFQSHSPSLVVGDTNFAWDIFVRDRATNSIQRVSLSYQGQEADSDSFYPTVSDDARFIAFESKASNLVKLDPNGLQDVFLRDQGNGKTYLVSEGIGAANGPSYQPHVSGDGRRVVFYSAASNLVGNDTNGALDVYVRDFNTSTTTLVSQFNGVVGNGPSRDPRITRDGRWITFSTDATNLGSLDSNGVSDVYLYDMQTGNLQRITGGTLGGAPWSANGASDRPDVSDSGRHVVFETQATNLVAGDTNGAHDVVVFDTALAAFSRVSVGTLGEANGASVKPRISSDGTLVSFTSFATNLVPGDTNGQRDVFLHDRGTGVTTRVSVGLQGQADSWCDFADLSPSGKYVAFHSPASNLVPGDTNGNVDVFLRGAQFLFDLTPGPFYPFDPFDFWVFTGFPPDPVLVAVFGVNGKPFFQVVHKGRFAANGVYSLRGTVPSGLAGIDVDLAALCGNRGSFEWSNTVTMNFR